MEEQVLTLEKEVKSSSLLEMLRHACEKIAPLWPLENFVAVNPFMGYADQKFEEVAQNLAVIGGIQMTLPVAFYKSKIQEGKITRKDLKIALSKKSSLDIDVDAFVQYLDELNDVPQYGPTLATLIDAASELNEKDWNRFVTSRLTAWASSYFDNGQADWKTANQNDGLFVSWKAEAEADLTPEIAGLKGFRNEIKKLPDDPLEAVQLALEKLEIPHDALPDYLHRLLMKMGGWSAYIARMDFDSKLYGGKDGKLTEFLAILICWEYCLFQCLNNPKLQMKWLTARKRYADKNGLKDYNQQLTISLILQEAFDLAAQRELVAKFTGAKEIKDRNPVKLKAQAIFCIDVRSEVFRRNLEVVDRGIATIGFAGFFAFPVNYVPIAHEKGEAQCPVLIKPGPTILEEIPDEETNRLAYRSRVLETQVKKLWKSFKTGAVTCFSFVSPMGLSYLPKLFTDSFGLTRPVPHPDKAGMKESFFKNKSISLKVATHNHQTVGIPLEQRIQMAHNALKAMSLTENFADFVLIAGHGSTTVNNPHASGLDCGACGGRSGESNARVAAAVLNDKDVRLSLKDKGISIPDHTVFLACLHDTTTDEFHIFNKGDVPTDRLKELDELEGSLKKAGRATRAERALRMSIDGNVDAAIKTRSNDWSQIRPEWGLAGCSSFVVAPRERTENVDLEGKAFLHSYEWKKDQDFSVLELIMTAPMVVTNWINMQYYASTVDNKNFGAGNKTLHNVTAGVGVLEGFSGDLRTGLPLQSVHDGEKYQHEPVRLKVLIEAPIEAMNTILEKHQNVKDLCDNGWIHLLAINEEGQVSHRYEENLNWEEI